MIDLERKVDSAMIDSDKLVEILSEMSLYDCLQECARSMWGFVMSPGYMIQHNGEFGLSASEAKLWDTLVSYTRPNTYSVFPAVATLAENLSMSERTVQRCLKKLEIKGFITITPRTRDNGSYTTNLYDPSPGSRKVLKRCIEEDPKLNKEYQGKIMWDAEMDEDADKAGDKLSPHKDTNEGLLNSFQGDKLTPPEVKNVKGSSTFGTTGRRKAGGQSIKAGSPTTEDTLERPPKRSSVNSLSRQEIVQKAISTGKASDILVFWQKVFEERLGTTCAARKGAKAYGQISQAVSLVKSHADLMVMMLYAIDQRVNDEPLWPGAEVRDPTLGLFTSAGSAQALISGLMSEDRYRVLRFGYNVQAFGQEAAEELFEQKELDILRDSMRRYKESLGDAVTKY